MIRSADGSLVRPVRELRSIGGQYPLGSGWNDPAAIPPPGNWNQQRAGVMVTTKTALQVDSVFTSLRVITNAIIKMGNPRAYNVAYDDWNQPYRQWLPAQPQILSNTWGGPKFQFDGTTRSVVSLGLFGECFWYVLDRDYLQRPASLEVLNPALVEIKDDPKRPGQLIYLYGTGTSKVTLVNEDLIHIPFLAMPGAQRGLNSIEFAGVSYALALAAMEYGQRWFSQGASPSYILSTEQKLGQDEVKRIAEKFLIEHSGLQAAHLPLVVDSGLKVQKTQSTPDEAQFINTLEYARMCIASWFGIPSHLVGGLADKGNVWGKRLDTRTPAPTPTGWTTMGDVEVGTTLLGPDGKPAKVTFATPIELAPESFRVEFNDGTHILADADHLWETTNKLGHTAVRNTREILDTLHYGARGDRNHRIRVAAPLDLPPADLPLHPYLVGLWLGDGATDNARVYVDSQDEAVMRDVFAELGQPTRWADAVGCKRVALTGATKGLRAVGVFGNKHIPQTYLRASFEQRLALLQGLMDSDGYAVSTRARVEFENTNETLARDVFELAATLGLRPTMGKYRSTKYGVDHGPLFRVGFDPKGLEVFRLPRKQLGIGKGGKASRAMYRTITAVIPVEPVLMRCITVDNDDHMFLAGEAMIPTHNTVEEQGLQMKDFSLSGYIVRLEEAYSSLLARGTYAALDESMITRASSADLAAEILALRTAGVETKNDIRVRKLRLPPLPDGDLLADPLNSNASPAVGMVYADEVAKETGDKPPVAPTAPEPEEGTP